MNKHIVKTHLILTHTRAANPLIWQDTPCADMSTQGLKKTYSCLNDQDPGCNCKGECEAVVIEGETLGPPSCMNLVFGIEDTWTLLPSYIVADNGDGTTSLPGEKAFDGETGQGDETKIRVIVTSSYGKLDVQATEPGCLYSTSDPQVEHFHPIFNRASCELHPPSLN